MSWKPPWDETPELTITRLYLQIDEETDELIPLIIAGGGGGKAFQLGHDPIKADGGLSIAGSGYSAATPLNGPGKAG